ncbi:uncharacterized protein PRCAT00003986001 [Priceomyces carsonii]|uniref:uncharacterized protein n=1 Tax=Priceomyces carsonii TaxID=28549 RepID=UPI002ED8957E|nr:unnamed protein product [Priceomyces carsonii]
MLRAGKLAHKLNRGLPLVIRCGFHQTAIPLAASVFRMPAMSPTMTEGGVVSWKYKPGEKFSGGDVLLEVETDKATIDVEAQDDGILWEILVNEGSSEIPVGQPIAFLAEQGDDLNTLEKPPLDDAKDVPKKKEASYEGPSEGPPKKETTSASKDNNSSDQKPLSGLSDIFQKANPNQKFSPSVEILLHENGLSREDAISKIQASGPNGRILRGDVLAYLHDIDISSVEKIAKFVKSRQHLDLSNIVLAEKKDQKQAERTPEQRNVPKNIVSVELISVLGEDVPNEKFKYAFERSIESSIRTTYAMRYPEFARSPTASSTEKDPFDDIIDPLVTQSRFLVFDIKYNFSGGSPAALQSKKGDAFDEILGISQSQATASEVASKVKVEFKIKFDEKLSDAKKFVDLFEESLISQTPTNEIKIS